MPGGNPSYNFISTSSDEHIVYIPAAGGNPCLGIYAQMIFINICHRDSFKYVSIFISIRYRIIMSRTLHVDLSSSRRSKRLVKSGYYLQPPGERTQLNEYSSEDDNASVHSNNSSIYSERAVHYNESPGASVFHKKRKRKGLDSPHLGTLPTQIKSQSLLVKKKSQHSGASTSARSNPDFSTNVTREETDHHQTSRENKTAIHSIRRTNQSHRYAHGESSSLIQTSFSAGQTAARNLTPDISSSQAQNHVPRHQSRYEVFGSGDQLPMMSSLRNEMIHSQVFSTPREVPEDTDEAASASAPHNIRQRNLHSHFSSQSGMESGEKGKIEFTFVPIILSKLSDVLRLFVACISSLVEYLCSGIYKTTLRIYGFDVWWLARRTSPLVVKVTRYLLLFLVLLLLLTSVYLFAAKLAEKTTETVLLPIQSIAGIFHTISQTFASAIAIFSGAGTKEDRVSYKSVTKNAQETSSPYLKSYLDVEELLVKVELGFADKLLEIRNEMIAMRKEQLRFNEKQQKIELRITDANDQQNAADTAMRAKLLVLEDAISTMAINHTSTGRSLKVDIEQLRGLLAEKSQASLKINEFNTQLRAFDARLNTLNELMMKSIQDVDQHVGNTTFIKEIAKMQFIENFLRIIKTTEASTEDRNSLNFLLITWLKRQGFAQVDEVEQSIKNTAVNHNLTLAVLERKFANQFETIKHEEKRHSSAITLETIVERPQKKEEPTKIAMEAAMKKWIRDELAIYSADRIGIADHALESAGGFVVSTRCSESYNRKTALISLFGMPIYYNINTPRSVIQASTLPGECWSFKGAEGYIVIALSGAVRPTSFTLEHIPRELSHYGRIDSAPKEFVVLGLSDVYDYEGKVLGKYRYEQVGPVIQQFSVTTPNADYFAHIELRVKSNWGHPEYTCLYRFRVHGNRQPSKSPPI